MTAFLLSWKGNNMRILYWFRTPKGSVSQYMLARSGTIRDNNPYLLFSLPTTLTNGSLLSNKGFRTALINSCDLSEPEKKSISDSQGDREETGEDVASNSTYPGCWTLRHIISSLDVIDAWWHVLSLFLSLKTKGKRWPREITWRFEICLMHGYLPTYGLGLFRRNCQESSMVPRKIQASTS